MAAGVALVDVIPQQGKYQGSGIPNAWRCADQSSGAATWNRSSNVIPAGCFPVMTAS